MATERADPLRVLHLITDLGKGGAERFLIDLTAALGERPEVDYRVGVLYDDDQYAPLTAHMPVVRLGYRTFSFTEPERCEAYSGLLDDFRPHVVHTHRWLAEFLSGQDVREDVAYVCHAHDNMVQLARFGPGTLRRREAFTNWLEKRWLIRNKYRRVPTTFVANSRHTEEYCRAVLPLRTAERVVRVPYGFDYDRFRVRDGGDGRPDRRLRLINVGSFQAKKNQILLVPIARALAEAGVDFELHLLGDGEQRAHVQAAVDASGLGDRITLHGNVGRVEEWMWRSDVYVHTAWYEPFGLVLLEAMAAGLPCVVLDGKGDRELIEEGRNGYVIAEQDPAAFAARIRELWSSPERYAALSTHAREYAKAYDMKRVVGDWLDLYRRCAEQAGT